MARRKKSAGETVVSADAGLVEALRGPVSKAAAEGGLARQPVGRSFGPRQSCQ